MKGRRDLSRRPSRKVRDFKEQSGTADEAYSKLRDIRPICDVCNRPVKGVTMIETGGQKKFLVDCHGDTEEVLLTEKDMEGMNDINAVRAFVGKTKPKPEDMLPSSALIPIHRQQLLGSKHLDKGTMQKLDGLIGQGGQQTHAVERDEQYDEQREMERYANRIRIRYEDVRCQIVFAGEPYAAYGIEKVHNSGLKSLLTDPFVICYIHPHSGSEGNIRVVMRSPTRSMVSLDALQKGATGDSMWGEVLWSQVIAVKGEFKLHDPRKIVLTWISKGLIKEDS